MKDRLEDFIEQNKDEFDIYEPGEQVWEKIETNKNSKKKRKISVSAIIWRAAAVITIFVISYFVHDFISVNNGNESDNLNQTIVADCEIPDEVIETESYYISQVNMRLEELNNFSIEDPEIRKEVEADLNELDNIYLDLKNDLCEDVANEEVIEAMIQNYRIKLQILEDILFKLNEIKNQKNNNNHEYNL